jgi:hypothetical protein
MTRGMLLVLVLVAAAPGALACGGTQTPAQPGPTPDVPGAATPALAIQSFMDAIKAQDLDELSLIWGSEKGPAKQVSPADQLRQRELIMECFLQHDSYRVVSDVATASDLHVVTLSLSKSGMTRETTTQVMQGPHKRWYVGNTDLKRLQDLCSGQTTKD